MPVGSEVTVPEPVPPLTATDTVCERIAKVAVTACAWFMRTVQVVAAPLQPPPDQPVKVAAAAIGTDAVRSTKVSKGYPCAQSAPQSTPAGLDSTRP